jgi:pimeloyl-ACP methyl ester carboxylesterase
LRVEDLQWRKFIATIVRGIAMSLTLPKQRRLSEPLVGSALRYGTANVDGIKIFYREAGKQEAPTLLLLHGFPSASHMFRDLIPLLADRLLAPDLPGFGQSDMPSRESFSYTFYASNVALYPKFQSYFRTSKPPLLAVWGRNDPYFVPAGAEAFKRDIPDAQVELLDTGNFANRAASARLLKRGGSL